MISIFVEDHWGMRTEFHVILSDPVYVLKQMIEETEGIPIGDQQLGYQGQEVQEDDRLESYSISNNSIIQLSNKAPPSLFVKLLTGKTLTCRPINLDAPVSYLKWMLEDLEGIPIDQQRCIFNGVLLSDDRSLSSYGVVNGSTIANVLRLRGGDLVSGHATVLHSWSGNMNHLKFNGLELIRGSVVNIVKTDRGSEWCYGRALDGTKQGLVPCNYVRTNEGHNINEEHNQHPIWKFFRWFPFISWILTTPPHTDQVPELNSDLPPNESTVPLPMFDYPQAFPMYFDLQYSGNRIEIALQYPLRQVPGERPHIKVKFKTSGLHRISAVHLRITAHDNVVVNVQPPSLEIGPVRESEIVTTRTRETKRQWKAGAGVQQTASFSAEGSGENAGSYSATESGTRSSTTTIIGQCMRTFTDNDTADWNLKEAKTSYGGDGIKGHDEGNGLSFSLLEMPHRISYDCWVTFVGSDGGERTYHKNSFGMRKKFRSW